ncbi:MAG TPA: CapA family protein [Miltoncostaeaceae bacterium]|nr:CapA family protein [Miltoncostaeaceae bacterium]
MTDERQTRRAAQRRRTRRQQRTLLALVAVMIVAVALAVAFRDGGDGGGTATAQTAAPGDSGDVQQADAAAPPAPPADDAQPIDVAYAGDTVMGSLPYGLPADGGASFFSQVDDLLTGDIVLGNLEGTLTTRGSSKCGSGSSNCYAFRTPPSYARWLKDAGFTVMNLANNHANDFGPVGLSDTVAALRRVGIRNTGRPGTQATVTAGGQKVAILGFASYTWSDPLTDIAQAQRRVRQAARTAPIVIVTFHGGAEGSDKTRVPQGTETFLGENRGDLRRFTHAVIDAGADLVVGSGPHVMRGMELYKDRLIAYSMGNFAGYAVFSLGGALSTSGVLQVTLNPDGSFRSGRLRPTQLVGEGTPAQGGNGVAMVRALSQQDFGARAPRIGANGAIRARN